MSFLRDLVTQKIQELGFDQAGEFFGIGPSLARQWATGSKPISLAAVEKVFDPAALPTGRFEEAQWEGKKVAILLPWYKSTNPLTAFSIMGLLDRAKMGVMMHYGDAFIVHTRNTLATSFLDSGMEWSLWIDDDMIIPWGNSEWFNKVTGMNFPEKFAGMHTLNRLLSHGKSLVGALYFGRRPDGKPMYAEATSSSAEAEFARSCPQDVLKQTRWVATGCLLVHRQVYVDMQATFPELAPQRVKEAWHFFSNSQTDLVTATKKALEILGDEKATEVSRIKESVNVLELGDRNSTASGRLVQGEDVTFSVRASRAGHQPYVDMGLIAGHYGNLCFGPRNTGE